MVPGNETGTVINVLCRSIVKVSGSCVAGDVNPGWMAIEPFEGITVAIVEGMKGCTLSSLADSTWRGGRAIVLL